MIPARPPLRERVKALPAFLVFALLGAFSLWLALSSLLPTTRALMSRAPLIALSPRDAIGLPLALLCFALAAMTLFPAPDLKPGRARDRHRKPDQRSSRGLMLCLGVAVSGVLLTVVTVPITEIVASTVMSNRGYLRCPAPLRERHPPLRWVLFNGHCP